MHNGYIDLRSDTVTRPTAEMRRAMADAEVGDDVLQDDPTVIRLEEKAAAMLGKPAALFVPSGTMGNTIAITVHTSPGDEVLMDRDAHTMSFEVGAAPIFAGVQTRQFLSSRGVPDLDDFSTCIRKRTLHAAGTALIVLENTHNRAGGAVIPLEVMKSVRAIAEQNGIAVHLDGARLFNAVVATGISASVWAENADTVSFCLSKGLGCPVGSLLCGPADLIEKARRVRKALGGGMRQAGVLAACGIVALDTMIDRLAEDHQAAKVLADGLTEIEGITVDCASVVTNMVYIQTQKPAAEVVAAVKEKRVLCLATAPHSIRLVTHKDITLSDIPKAIHAFKAVA